MKSYIIILQLGYPETSYTALINYIKSASLWAHPMNNVWIIKTPKTSAEIRDGVALNINIGLGDKVAVIAVQSADWATNNVDKAVTDWMKNNM